MYEQSNSIGTYLFVGVTASAMLVQISSSGEINVMTVVVAALWGLTALGFGKILWEFLGVMIMPYIHSEEPVPTVPKARAQFLPQPIVPSDETSNSAIPNREIDTPLQVPAGDFERHINKHVNDGKLWAKGMTALTSEEEKQLRNFFRKRWESKEDDTYIPESVGDSLLKKLQERGIASGSSLTQYGERIIPWKENYNILLFNQA